MYAVQTPATSDCTVIFPQNIWSKNFDASFYNPALTGGRATLEEINQVLAEVTVLKKPFHRRIICAVWLYVLGLIACIALMVVVPILSVPDYDDDDYDDYDDSDTMMFVGIFGGLFGMIAVIVIFIVYVRRTMKATRVPVQAFFDGINPNFASRGLRWHAPLHFPRWVELWKDYVGQAAVAQPNYQPPAVNQQYQNYPIANGTPYQMPGAQPQNYGVQPQNYGVQPQGYQNYGAQPQAFNNFNQQGQQNFGNYNGNQL